MPELEPGNGQDYSRRNTRTGNLRRPVIRGLVHPTTPQTDHLRLYLQPNRRKHRPKRNTRNSNQHETRKSRNTRKGTRVPQQTRTQGTSHLRYLRPPSQPSYQPYLRVRQRTVKLRQRHDKYETLSRHQLDTSFTVQ